MYHFTALGVQLFHFLKLGPGNLLVQYQAYDRKVEEQTGR
jgi:hypothetical protein